MAGFQINLKAKGVKKKTETNRLNKPGIGIRNKLLEKKTLKKPNALRDSDSDDDDEVQTMFISSFDKTGDKSAEHIKEKKLMIIPGKLQASIPRLKPYFPNQEQKVVIEAKEENLKYGLNTRIPKQETGPSDEKTSDEKMPQTLEERARESLLTGESAVDSSGMSIPIEKEHDNNINMAPEEATAEEYENVPVEEFGAALLRGMGWKADNKKTTKKKPELNGKKGLFLGIGAKTVEADIMEELVAKKGIKFQVPLVKRENK